MGKVPFQKNDYKRNLMNYSRGEIYWADLNDSGEIGSELKNSRPVLIIQNDIGNLNSSTVIVVCFSSQAKAFKTTHIPIQASAMNGLNYDSYVTCEQLKTLSKSRLFRFCGKLSNKDMEAVESGIRDSLSLSPVIKEVEKIVEKEVIKKFVRNVEVIKYPLLEDVVNYIETAEKVTLREYQKDMIKAYFETGKVFSDRRMGKTLVLNGIANYFKSLDEHFVSQTEAQKQFPMSFMFKELLTQQEKPKDYNVLTSTKPTNEKGCTNNITPIRKASGREPQTPKLEESIYQQA